MDARLCCIVRGAEVHRRDIRAFEAVRNIPLHYDRNRCIKPALQPPVDERNSFNVKNLDRGTTVAKVPNVAAMVPHAGHPFLSR
jgi:hypothetical protein